MGEQSEPVRAKTYGLCTDQNLTWQETRERWQYFESLGFDSLWVCDHFQQPSRPQGPYFEGWTLLAALGEATSRARIGVLVSSNTFRNPALLAKQAVTVDHISGGRLDLGIGAGWYEPEHVAFGIPFGDPPQLVSQYAEAVELIDLLMRQEVTSFTGRHYSLQEAPFRPGPVQQPRPPLTLGAHKRKMLAIVARFADRWNSHGTVNEIRERNLMLDEACHEIGRDPTAIIRSMYGWTSKMGIDPWQSVNAFQEVVGVYGEAGITDFIIDAPGPDQFGVLEAVAVDVVKLQKSGARIDA